MIRFRPRRELGNGRDAGSRNAWSERYSFIKTLWTCYNLYHNHHHHRNIRAYIYHHHDVLPPARISLTLSRHFSLSFIASGRSSEPHPVSSHSCWMYVRAGRPAFARPYVGVHREYTTYELVPASPAVTSMSGSSNLDSFRDRRQVAV